MRKGHHMWCDKLRKSDVYFKRTDTGDAVAFIKEYHYSKSCSRALTHVTGMYCVKTDRLLGVACWMIANTKVVGEKVLQFVKTKKEVTWKNVCNLSRLAVSPEVPLNGASLLLGQSIRELKKDDRYVVAVTYADEGQGHTGAIYKATNWVWTGKGSKSTVWIDPKTGAHVAQKATVNRSVAQMKTLGYVKKGASYKQRFCISLDPAVTVKGVA